MPGLVVFRRRWSTGSDDLVIPAFLLMLVHFVWLIVLSVVYGLTAVDPPEACFTTMEVYTLGYIIIIVACLLTEGMILWISSRGTIMNTHPRAIMGNALYVRIVVALVELGWLLFGSVWLIKNFSDCPDSLIKRVILGATICDWIIKILIIVALFCTFDTAGKVAYESHYRQGNSTNQEYRGSRLVDSNLMRRRNASNEYRHKWKRRCQWWCCCVGITDRKKRTSFQKVAEIFADFFSNLDVVPSDVLAGLILLRQQQKAKIAWVVSEGSNDIYQYLSGAAIFPDTRFLRLKHPLVRESYKKVIHFMRYSVGAYGWPMYVCMNVWTGCCRLLPKVRCCACCRQTYNDLSPIEDNCCHCNFAALRKVIKMKKKDVVFVSFHNDVGETPFYVALDHELKKVVICVRGTLSMQDVITDLCAEPDVIPLDTRKPDWLAHKGMIDAALYIQNLLYDQQILECAFNKCPRKNVFQNRKKEHNTSSYSLVVTGHSLGAGTAAILSIMLQQHYPTLHCYAYSPPGGLLRIGLPQLNYLRSDIINAIKMSKSSKVKIVASMCCQCCKEVVPFTDSVREEAVEMEDPANPCCYNKEPLYPPGRIIHIVRNHPKEQSGCCSNGEPVYQAIWADNTSFNETLISPRMMSDHMPENVFDALEKVLINVGPAKPTRRLPECERMALLSESEQIEPLADPNPTNILSVETSFTNYNPDVETTGVSRHSSLSWEYTSTLEVAAMTPVLAKLAALKSPPPACRETPEKGASETMQSSVVDDVSAPIASPENLSDTSSLDSINSCKFLSRDLELAGDLDKLRTNKHSALKRVYPEDLPVTPPPSPIDLNDSELAKEIFAHFDKNPYSQSTPRTKSNQFTISATIECDNNNAPETLYTEDNARNANIDDRDVRDTFDVDEGSRLMYDKLKKSESQEILKLTYECETSSPENKEVFHCHSPVNDSNQQAYEAVIGHYPVGGRGYPHGSYHLPDQSRHRYESDSDLKALQQSQAMHRSKEEGDIPNIQETAEVFENGRMGHHVQSTPILTSDSSTTKTLLQHHDCL